MDICSLVCSPNSLKTTPIVPRLPRRPSPGCTTVSRGASSAFIAIFLSNSIYNGVYRIISRSRTRVNTLSEQQRSAKARKYQMNKRAEQVDTTRQRIVDAAVALHGSVGPARTTISGVAEQARVTRLTVYRHFADEEALFSACSSHWLSQQQLPDPAAWRELSDPLERLHAGLTDLYRFYRGGESMLAHIYADWDALPESRRKALEERN